MDDGGGLYLLPELYEVVNGPQTALETATLVRIADRFAAHSGPHSVWLEPACGTGRFLSALSRRNFRVRGYDPQPAMLAYAVRRLQRRQRPPAPDPVLLAADFTTPASALRGFGAVDVAICPVNSLRHLASDRDVLAHLEQIAGLLAPGGVYLVGLDLLHPGQTAEEDVSTGARGRLRVTQIVQYLPPVTGSRRERVIVEMVVDRPRGREHHSFAYDLRTYNPRQWSSLIARSALRRLAVCDASGRPVARTARLPYQIEVLAER